ncbi:hypothetical protein KP509_03G084900 [Ceratopteris richardii]|uniref:Uncharacterized protein n=1 Tax=Ceratopteris richardii TaxID=49495 RepID=A0A8T2V8V9_CERRI|nr:hypothetical protein KP509_03G084900 [Ceratopteris richardii]
MYYSIREDPEPLLLAGCTVRRLMNGLAFPVQSSSACAVFRSYRGNGLTLQYARPVQFYGHCSAFGWSGLSGEREREGEKRYTVFTYILCAPTLARTVIYTYFPAKTTITLLCIHNCRNAHHVWMTCIFFELFRKCLGVSPVMLA